ncbi:MAG: ABC transporter permease [Myxococcota bacterium]
MRRYLLRRLGLMAPTFLGITLLTFAVAHLAPGDPLQLDEENLGAARADVAKLRAARGLDAPLPVQYVRWLSRVIRLDFGRSLIDQRPVSEKLAEALPRTALVSGLAVLFAFGLAVPLGVFLATRRTLLSRALSAALTVVWGVPTFWVAVLLLLVFSSPRALDVLPMQGLGDGGLVDLAWHLVLPVLCLTYPTLALVTRQVRSAMQDALAQDFVKAARARGIPERRVVWRHALRNSLLPVVTLLGFSLPHVLGGSVLIERVFGIPGMGLLAFDSVGTRDYPTVMGAATVMAVATMLSMLAVDVAYGFIDPRIRVEEAS